MKNKLRMHNNYGIKNKLIVNYFILLIALNLLKDILEIFNHNEKKKQNIQK